MSSKGSNTAGVRKPTKGAAKPKKSGKAEARTSKWKPRTPNAPAPGSKKRTRPKQPGKPKKKSGRQMELAHRRGAELSAIHWIDDANKRRVADACFQRRYIPGKLLAKEASLQQTKWVGYRYMTPLEAAELFGREYIAAYRRVYARHFDPKDAAKKQPIKSNLGENTPGEMTSLWIARQYADAHGIPYDVFLDIVMEGKVAGDKWRQPPVPCQLLSGKQTAARLRQRPTRDEVTARLFQPHWDLRFYGGGAVGDSVRAAALRELRADVLRADDRPGRLAKYLGTRGLLSEAQARTLFDADAALVDAALMLKPTIHRVASERAEAYVPSCMGNRNPADPVCKACPVTKQCMRMKTQVTNSLIKTTGSGDPRLAHKRQLGRERQQRCRIKKTVMPAVGS